MVELNPFTVSSLYDFSATGPGTFTFDPVPSFQVVDDTVGAASNTVSLDIANARSVAVTVTGDASKRSLHPDMPHQFKCNDLTQAGLIFISHLESEWLAANAIDYIKRLPAPNVLFRKYFGSSGSRVVISAFERVVNDNIGSRDLSCLDSQHKCSNIAAYSSSDTIHYCPPFFCQVDATKLCSKQTKIEANNIRGSTTISQVLQVLGLAGNSLVGCTNAGDPNADTNEKIHNGDSYGVSPHLVFLELVC